MTALHEFQVWLVRLLGQDTPVADLMRTAWGWPIAESLHFLGLCLLIGGVGVFDLRLLGVGRAIPIAVAHRLIPWGIAGFALNAATGALFLWTEPDQYVYNPAFHLKILFIAVAGLNAATFYLTSYRQVFAPGASPDAPVRARVIAALSLGLWVGIIVCGRLITFFRPGPCFDDPGLLLTCDPY